jgi:hypothetical protein
MNVVFIGNGFDIMSELETQYKFFYRYLKANELDFFNKVLFWFTDLNDSEASWSDFENNLRRISLGDINEGISTGITWKSPAFVFSVSNVLNNLYDKLSDFFVNWITECNSKLTNKDYPTLPKYELKNYEDMLFLNFNYTKTLESLYNVKIEDIIHIHGKIGLGKLIFGHGDSTLSGFRSFVPEDPMSPYVDISDNQHNYILRDLIQEVGKNLYKDTSQIIQNLKLFSDDEQNINNIFVIGHSYNDIDRAYYEELVKHTNARTKWFFGYYSDEDYKKMSNMIETLMIVNYDIKTNDELRNFLFRKV